jgi:hypothetical protein
MEITIDTVGLSLANSCTHTEARHVCISKFPFQSMVHVSSGLLMPQCCLHFTFSMPENMKTGLKFLASILKLIRNMQLKFLKNKTLNLVITNIRVIIFVNLANKGTNYVPTTLVVLATSSLIAKILAMPKSDIFGFSSSSNKMLLAFRSL